MESVFIIVVFGFVLVIFRGSVYNLGFEWNRTTGNFFAESGKKLCIWWYISLQCITALSGRLKILNFYFALYNIDRPMKSKIGLPLKNNILEPVLTGVALLSVNHVHFSRDVGSIYPLSWLY